MQTMPPRLIGAFLLSKGPVQSREGMHDGFRANFTLRAGGSARMARPTLAEIALDSGSGGYGPARVSGLLSLISRSILVARLDHIAT
eukprot:457063-Prymnesium_polylepis.4